MFSVRPTLPWLAFSPKNGTVPDRSVNAYGECLQATLHDDPAEIPISTELPNDELWPVKLYMATQREIGDRVRRIQ